MKKTILDACCGSRMFWFDKQNPNVLFQDIREEEHILCDGRKLTIKPDVVADFTNMPHPNESFKVVVFDPPHLVHLGKNSWLCKKYGKLEKHTWKQVLKDGVNECMRVLEPNGSLVFKWNEDQISVSQILEAIDHTPLFGHTTGRSGKTKWLFFMKGMSI